MNFTSEEYIIHPKVYIVLINFNGWADTLLCLQSIFDNNYENYQIVIVDSNSTDDSIIQINNWLEINGLKRAIFSESPKYIGIDNVSEKSIQIDDFVGVNKPSKNAEIVTDFNDQIILISLKNNLGFAYANNRAIELVLNIGDAKFLWLLNNDTKVARNALRHLVNSALDYKRKKRKIGLIGSKLLNFDNGDVIQGVGGIYNKYFSKSHHLGRGEFDRGQYDSTVKVSRNVDYPLGASMLVDAEFIEDVGLMCEEYFLYCEELDWVLRGKKRGWDIGYCSESRIYHKEGASIGTISGHLRRSRLSEYWVLRNRIVFTRKHFRSYLPLVYLSFLGVFWNRLKRGHFSRIPIVFRAMFGLDFPG